jgi:amidohydrolase
VADSIKDEILSLKDEMIQIRRDFHQYPELGMEEKRTSKKIAKRLGGLSLEVNTSIGRTGVVGLLKGKDLGKTVFLRADMDALPIHEKNNVPYRSRNDGIMHACGHDGHMAILLTVAKILADHREDLSGQIKFVFQPGEEGFAGARFMIEDGVLKNPKVDAAFGLHLNTGIPLGSLALRAGNMMACMDSFTIKIKGKGGHAASPEEGADAILMSAQVISMLQSLISKEVSPTTPLVVHVGTIHGGSAFNIVADYVELKGTVRTHDEILRKSIPERIERIVKGVTAALRGAHKLDYQFGYLPVVNDAGMTELVKGVGAQVVGADQVLEIAPVMISDDMGFFLREVPGCYFLVGAGSAEKGFDQPHHSARFDFDEEALVVGAEMMVRVVLAYLTNH